MNSASSANLLGVLIANFAICLVCISSMWFAIKRMRPGIGSWGMLVVVLPLDVLITILPNPAKLILMLFVICVLVLSIPVWIIGIFFEAKTGIIRSGRTASVQGK